MNVLFLGAHYLVKFIVSRRNLGADNKENENESNDNHETKPVLGDSVDALQVAIRESLPRNCFEPNQESHGNANIPNVVTNIDCMNGISNINSPNRALALGQGAISIGQLVQVIGSHCFDDQKLASLAEKMKDCISKRHRDNLKITYPIATDDNFALRLQEVFEQPIILDLSNNAVINDNALNAEVKRILLEGDFGSGRKTLMRRVCFDAANGNLPLFNMVSPHSLRLLCDISKVATELETESLENVLIRMFHGHNATSDVELTKNILKTHGEETFIFLSGYEDLTEEIKNRVNCFFVKCPENVEFSSVFDRSTIYLALSTEALKANKEMFRQSFDGHLVIQGLSRDSRRNLAKQILENYEKNFDSFLMWLNGNKLSFLLEMSPFTILYVCYSYIRITPVNRYEFLDYLMTASGVGYLGRSRRNLFKRELKKITQQTILGIGSAIFRMETLSAEHFDKSHLKMARDLGWITSDYRVDKIMFHKYFVTKYLNTEMGMHDLKRSLNFFLFENRINFKIITNDLEGISTLKYMFLTSPGEIFTLALSKFSDEFHVRYYIHDDFVDITSDNQPCFTVVLEKSGSIHPQLFEQLQRLSPLHFVGEHFLIAAAQILHETDFTCSITFPLREVQRKPLSETIFNYDLDFNESNVALRYHALFPNDDIVAVVEFVTGMNQLLSLWPQNSNFSLSQVSLKLDPSNLTFANKCIIIAFGPGSDRLGNFNLATFINYWIREFTACSGLEKWRVIVGDILLDSSNYTKYFPIKRLHEYASSMPIHVELFFGIH